MSDGRKNNKGTKGNKGGRKPNDVELKFIEKLDISLIVILLLRN